MNMTFLNSTVSEDVAIWREFFRGLPPYQKDVHFLPEYVEAHIPAGTDGCAAFALYEDHTGYGGQPFVRKRNSCVSPYGYGAVFGTIKQVPDFCKRYRCHPFIGNSFGSFEKHVVVMDLGASIDAGLRKGHKSSIALAQRSGVTVEEVQPSARNIETFWKLYRRTMERRQASEGWHLSCDHFVRMARLMDEHFALFFARIEDEVESACIVLHGYDTAYYHFAATRYRHRNLGVNNLMVYKVAEWAKGFGYRKFHLGGGVTAAPDDSVLKFKTGFSDEKIPVYCHGKQ